jgi:ApbE superfamily uncharacterized protein (UPF0280 family)
MTGWGAPQAAMLPDGTRLHLHHGPIDLIVFADAPARRAAYAAATARFQTVLDELVAELPLLRSPAPVVLSGPVARRMAAAVDHFVPVFITPMAAVAGAVADEIVAAMAKARVAKAFVNNGGDIALLLAPGHALTTAMAGGQITLAAADPVRGIATSGWRGRSQSLGIADAVTVLARNAAAADAAATLIANAVDLPGHPAIARRPAVAVKADSDLGDRLVTVGVGPLTDIEADIALTQGRQFADSLLRRGLIHAAYLTLNRRTALAGPLSLTLPEPIHA